MTDQDPGERLDALEIRVAFQEDALAQLDQAIISQQETLHALRSEIDALHQRLRALTTHLSDVSDDDGPPPHY